MRNASLAFALLLLAGCSGPGANDPTKTAEDANVVHAPWWPVGSWWDVDLRHNDRNERARIVNFLNDTETHHFWLGVADRDVAIDHALHDTNPLLGRIHWEILTPHEGGIHANGMFSFPMEPGERFEGIMFGREWEMEAAAGASPGSLTFTGRSSDGAEIAYDYRADYQWFSRIDIKDSAGATLTDVDATARGGDAHGTYWFHRGRDYYLGPKEQGTHDETFLVPQEDPPGLKSLALEVNGQTSGILRIEIRDPSGNLRYSENLPASSVNDVEELDDPTPGEWTVRYVGTGTFTGVIEVVGLIEYTRTI